MKGHQHLIPCLLQRRCLRAFTRILRRLPAQQPPAPHQPMPMPMPYAMIPMPMFGMPHHNGGMGMMPVNNGHHGHYQHPQHFGGFGEQRTKDWASGSKFVTSLETFCTSYSSLSFCVELFLIAPSLHEFRELLFTYCSPSRKDLKQPATIRKSRPSVAMPNWRFKAERRQGSNPWPFEPLGHSQGIDPVYLVSIW
ncbi:uncharacterized protein A4U43_C07F1600 [Asparagus officinalis]|uniref:Uncharacterized protein n=1 Tax=Asparagus officinalis TaxID=4686 RepID=A0A5P1EBP8_ASPOF|nr:uncharacterized protein A4U43_C07F1600 [Asparagus officinalis]